MPIPGHTSWLSAKNTHHGGIFHVQAFQKINSRIMTLFVAVSIIYNSASSLIKAFPLTLQAIYWC